MFHESSATGWNEEFFPLLPLVAIRLFIFLGTSLLKHFYFPIINFDILWRNPSLISSVDLSLLTFNSCKKLFRPDRSMSDAQLKQTCWRFWQRRKKGIENKAFPISYRHVGKSHIFACFRFPSFWVFLSQFCAASQEILRKSLVLSQLGICWFSGLILFLSRAVKFLITFIYFVSHRLTWAKNFLFIDWSLDIVESKARVECEKKFESFVKLKKWSIIYQIIQ